MRDRLIKKGLVLGIMLFFLGASILPTISSIKFNNEHILEELRILENCDWIVDDEGDVSYWEVRWMRP